MWLHCVAPKIDSDFAIFPFFPECQYPFHLGKNTRAQYLHALLVQRRPRRLEMLGFVIGLLDNLECSGGPWHVALVRVDHADYLVVLLPRLPGILVWPEPQHSPRRGPRHAYQLPDHLLLRK